MSTLSTGGVDVIQRRPHLAFGSRGLPTPVREPKKSESPRVHSRLFSCCLLLHGSRSVSQILNRNAQLDHGSRPECTGTNYSEN